jgi:hypothetical protein
MLFKAAQWMSIPPPRRIKSRLEGTNTPICTLKQQCSTISSLREVSAYRLHHRPPHEFSCTSRRLDRMYCRGSSCCSGQHPSDPGAHFIVQRISLGGSMTEAPRSLRMDVRQRSTLFTSDRGATWRIYALAERPSRTTRPFPALISTATASGPATLIAWAVEVASTVR